MAVRERRHRPLRVGVWAYNGSITLLVEGIGVFVHNVTRGLLDLQDGTEVVLVVGPGDATLPAVKEFTEVGGKRFRVLSFTTPDERFRASVRNWLRWAAERRHRRDRNRPAAAAVPRRHRILDLARRVARRMPRNDAARDAARRLKRAAEWVALPVLMAGGLARLLAGRAVNLVTSPVKTNVKRLKAWAEKPSTADPAQVIKEANVDAWLVPYVLIGYPLDEPSVLVIHDLVTHHFPHGFAQATLDAVGKLAPENASRATLCACMSEFIRESDLQGVLNLPDEKIAVVRPAAPRDFPETTPEVEASIRERLSTRPFLLYPAAFRPYKNHEALIDGLGELHRRGHRDFDVVFTGSGQFTAACKQALERHGLHDRVHVMRFVSREELAALYRQAFATVVPSLYEQGSFPVYEALHFGCPVACSDIPPLREQSATMGSAMLYFEPRNPASLADAVEKIIKDREGVRRRQAAAKSSLWERRWVDAAAEWVLVLEEAAARGRAKGVVEVVAPEQRAERSWIEGVVRRPEFAADFSVEIDGKTVKPSWPRRAQRTANRPIPPEAFVFLPEPCDGDRRMHEVVEGLLAVNADRRDLRLSVGIDVRQKEFARFRRSGESLNSVHRVRLAPISRHCAAQVLGRRPEWLINRPDGGFQFFDIGGDVALRADAWLSLSDRFSLPLLPARPYAVYAHETNRRLTADAAEAFDTAQMTDYGIRPTLGAAEWVAAATPWSAARLEKTHGVGGERLLLVPDSCDPAARFGGIKKDFLPFLAPGFLLAMANENQDGIENVVAAFVRLKQILGGNAPQLVICGRDADRLSPILTDGDGVGWVDRQVRAHHPVRATEAEHQDRRRWRAIRRVIRESSILEGRDVVVLGELSDSLQVDLFEKAGIVVDGSGLPDGSRRLVEATWFGKPTVAARTEYSAWYAERFRMPTRFFPAGDVEMFAAALIETVSDRESVSAELENVKTGLSWAEFSQRRFIERLYERLVELAAQGRPAAKAPSTRPRSIARLGRAA